MTPSVAMVLAAGRGERMQPLTATRAKPALPVLGMPLVARVVSGLAAQGVSAFGVNAYHQPQSLQDALDGTGAAELELFVEQELMGSAGALLFPRPRLEREDAFVLHNADTLLPVPLAALAAAAEGDERHLGALLVRPGRTRGYGGVELEGSRVRSRFAPDEEPRGEHPATFLGVAVARRELLRHVPPGRPSDLFPDVILPLLARGFTLAAVPYDGSWIEFTSPRTYLANIVRLVAGARRSGSAVLPGGDAPVRARPGGALFVHPAADVDDAVMIEGGVAVERGAVVARGAILRNTVVLEEARIGWGASLERVVVAQGVTVPRAATYRDGVLTLQDGNVVFRAFAD